MKAQSLHKLTYCCFLIATLIVNVPLLIVAIQCLPDKEAFFAVVGHAPNQFVFLVFFFPFAIWATHKFIYVSRVLIEASTDTSLNQSWKRHFQIGGPIALAFAVVIGPFEYSTGTGSDFYKSAPDLKETAKKNRHLFLSLANSRYKSIFESGPSDPSGDGSDLRLMSAENKGEIPNEGRSHVIIAKNEDQLHFRIFDVTGDQIFDKAEEDLPNSRSDLEELKKLLAPYWDEGGVPAEKRKEIFDLITSITGQTPGDINKDPSTARQSIIRDLRKEYQRAGYNLTVLGVFEAIELTVVLFILAIFLLTAFTLLRLSVSYPEASSFASKKIHVNTIDSRPAIPYGVIVIVASLFWAPLRQYNLFEIKTVLGPQSLNTVAPVFAFLYAGLVAIVLIVFYFSVINVLAIQKTVTVIGLLSSIGLMAIAKLSGMSLAIYIGSASSVVNFVMSAIFMFLVWCFGRPLLSVVYVFEGDRCQHSSNV